ncbi:hypothetical protein GGR53DRAFT_527392 [Hypoxylon sp. FL1150]|nr:hypothetical protein GGR53DRAFT_527392 [Hypoxylon sp. FL1150]
MYNPNNNLLIPLVPSHPNRRANYEQNKMTLLLSMSLEIRLKIYEFAISEDGPIFPFQIRAGLTKGQMCNATPSDHSRQVPVPTAMVYPILKMGVCRQIYHELESTALFYQVNSFAFIQFPEFHDFLATLTPYSRHNLRNLRFQYHLRADADVEDQSSNLIAPWTRTDEEWKIYMVHLTTLLRDCPQLKEICLDVESQSARSLSPEQSTTHSQDQAEKLLARINPTDPSDDDRSLNQVWRDDRLLDHLRQLPQLRVIGHFPCIRGGIDPSSKNPTELHKDRKVTIDLTGTSSRYSLPYTNNNKAYNFLETEDFQKRINNTRRSVAKWKRYGMKKHNLPFPLPADCQNELEKASDSADIPLPGYKRVKMLRDAEDNLALLKILPLSS